MSLIALIVLGVFGILPIVQAASEGRLFFSPADVTVLKGSETSVLPLWPLFDLEVRVANVTNIVGIKFSCEWNPAHFKFVGIMMSVKDPSDFIYEAAKGSSEYYGPGYTSVNSSALHEFYYTQLGGTYGYAAKNWTGANTGLVTKLRFNYTGPSPSPDPGTWINTYINFTNRDLTELMRTNWAKWITGTTLSPTDFSTMDGFHLLYKGVSGTPSRPVASKTYTPSLIYAGDTVSFDAHLSTGGFDGDDSTTITEWRWDFGDGNSSWVEYDAYVDHKYASAGSKTVVLVVYAPPIGWYDPSYINTSLPHTEILSVKVAAFTYIDVYTEDFRWPSNDAGGRNGTGPDQPADCFRPQENVDLYAIVVYNDDIVQNKLVKFYVEGPKNPVYNYSFVRTAYSSNGTVWNGTGWMPMPEGVAWIPFRIPWPCTDAQTTVFGVWTVTVQVALPDVKPGEETVYEDTMNFKVCWGVTIVGLRTLNATGDPVDAFKKCTTITIEADLTNCYKLQRWAVVAFVVYDDVGTIIGSAIISQLVPGEATWCTPGTVTVKVDLHIPKWAYVGAHGMVYANAYTDLPWLPATAEPWCPEASASIEIVKA